MYISWNSFSGDIGSSSMLKESSLREIKEFIDFKTAHFENENKDIELNDKISFNKKVSLSLRFKCINWFTYKYSDYLRFNILKVREYGSNKVFYFQFLKHEYKVYPEDQVKGNTVLKTLYKLSQGVKSKNFSPLEIYTERLKDGESMYISHYKSYGSKNTFFQEKNNIKETCNDVKKNNYIIFETGFFIPIESECALSFRNERFMYVMNNINPSGSYEIQNFDVFQSSYKDNVYFIPHHMFKSFFKKTFTSSFDVDNNWISFDIESECVRSREISSEKNIITHIGFEYFSEKYYNDFKEHDQSFSFCFVNIDFHIRQEINKKNKSSIIKYTNMQNDRLYEKIRKRSDDSEYTEEIYPLLSRDDILLPESFDDITKMITSNNMKKYVMCSEIKMITYFIHLIAYMKDTDCLLTYNGHSYDYAQMGRRLCYLKEEKIEKGISLPSLYDLSKPRFTENKNEATTFSIINMETNNPFYSIDIFNYIQKFKTGFDTFSLKNVAKATYNLKAIVYPEVDNKFKIYFLEDTEYNIFKFIQVLLSSNYCYINDVAFVITNKEDFIKKEESIYSIDIKSICSDFVTVNGIKILKRTLTIMVSDEEINPGINSPFDWLQYKKNVEKICLSKDDVEIGKAGVFDTLSSFDIADYCIHDSLLCRYLMKDLSIKENNDTFAGIYYLSQSCAFAYRNSTNFLGYLFKTCYDTKKFILTTKKIDSRFYSGGRVFEPTDTFLKEPVMLFDFESLYPSIMINYNISPDVLILIIDLKDKLEFDLIKVDIEHNYPPSDYTVVYNTNPGVFQILVFTKIYKDGTRRSGLLGYMLSDLKVKRKNYKKAMAEYEKAGNTYQRINCDMIQNCVKVLMNSVYGLLGSSFHGISCKFTSQAVTLIGVRSISFVADYLNGAVIENKTLSVNNGIDYNIMTGKIMKPNNSFEIDIPFNDRIELELVYGDTDSVMICPRGINKANIIDKETSEELYKKRIYYLTSLLGNKLNDFINNVLMKGNLNMEFEAIYMDMIILAKKKYKSYKTEPRSGTDTLSIDEIDKLALVLKEDNKGISLKRRDNCMFQKRSMLQFFSRLSDEIKKVRFLPNKITSENMESIIISVLSDIRKKLLEDILYERISIQDFTISCAYRGEYKAFDNHIRLLVENHNRTSRETICKGDRFNFLFEKKNIPNVDYCAILELPLENQTSELLKKLSWKFICSGFNDMKSIKDDSFNFKDSRIYFEIYLHKLYKDVETVFPDSGIYKKILRLEEQVFDMYSNDLRFF